MYGPASSTVLMLQVPHLLFATICGIIQLDKLE